MHKKKNDQYRKIRGGRAYFIELFCAQCSTFLLLYQKDGDGRLKRCYLNRIFEPKNLKVLQHSKNRDLKKLPKLSCTNCKEVVGAPIQHHDGRLALRLRPGYFYTKRYKE